MKKVLLLIKENWKDPVWSKVIATVIITASGLTLTTLYSLVISFVEQISFNEVWIEVINYLNTTIEFSLWILLLFVFIYVVLVAKPFIEFIRQLYRKLTEPSPKKEEEPKKAPRATEHSTSLFHRRMAGAFPGIRGIQWFDNPKVATERLSILLQEPLRFSQGSRDAEEDPFWWFRGSSSLYIERFEKLGARKVLMNFDQLKIKRIAANIDRSYYKDYVYVEVEGEKQTGLYNFKKEDLENYIKTFGYSWEEYGLIKNRLGWTTPIRREEYDDGAAVIRGKVRETFDAVLRIRYLSSYNFIIAANGSPYNSHKFDSESEDYFNGILKGDIEPEQLFDYMRAFLKHQQ